MPVYNREDYLEETLKSIADQHYSYWELIAIDDGSVDHSVSILNNFAFKFKDKCTILSSAQRQSGAAACRNIGLQQAKGKYIIFVDSDDTLSSFCLEQRIKAMNENVLSDWAVFRQYEWNSEKEEPYKLFSKAVTSREEAISYFLQMNPPWQTMAALWKKEALLKLNGFDESFFFMEDPDLHLRALLDKTLQVEIKFNLPADCYYRVSNIPETKVGFFYYQSIISRFHFVLKTIAYLPALVSIQILKEYKQFIRKGYFDFIKVFLLSRLKEHKKEFMEVSRLLAEAGILSLKDRLLIKCITRIFTSDSSIVKKTRIRGVVKKLFLPESKFIL